MAKNAIAAPSSPDRVNILMVDDSPDKLLAMESVLESLGQNLVKVPSGEEALRILLRQDFALILLDVNMPGMDGIAYVQELRGHAPPHLRDLPVILITGEKNSELRERGLAAGANAFLQKPVTPENLRDTVRAWLPNR